MAYIKIKLLGLSGQANDGQAKIRYRNFFKQDFSKADVICIFLTPKAMKKLKLKLQKEVKPGARIISYAFHLPGWTETKKDKPNQKTTAIYIYQK